MEELCELTPAVRPRAVVKWVIADHCQQLSNTIRHMFEAYDVNKDGFLDKAEMRDAFASMVRVSEQN